VPGIGWGLIALTVDAAASASYLWVRRAPRRWIAVGTIASFAFLAAGIVSFHFDWNLRAATPPSEAIPALPTVTPSVYVDPSGSLSLVTEAELAGSNRTWSSRTMVQPGALVSILVSVSNVGHHSVNRVTVLPAVLPAEVTLVPGSVKLVNGNYPTGFRYTVSDLSSGFDLGNYNPGINAFLLFSVRVANSGFPCGLTTLVEDVTASADGVARFSGEAATLVVAAAC
jgi:uncharacterized repeat protein (TIGR01451 family)